MVQLQVMVQVVEKASASASGQVVDGRVKNQQVIAGKTSLAGNATMVQCQGKPVTGHHSFSQD